ncbi:MAG: hypothetical protein QOG00_3966 [Pyrinomonadaceae bacterium]|jgi:hypothetical protein|nr:hypothetical protein [Pyrinomonadaceae bacterium]MDQ1614035.1 hypothetical protein [Pyrinomonadaceae bacterium]
MSRKKLAKAKRRRKKAPRPRFTVFSRAKEFLRHHRVATILGGMIALLGCLASIYSVSEPNIVAVSPTTTAKGELRAEPGGGLSHWVEIEQRFKNTSWRGGGHITALQMVPHSLDTATWLSNRTVPNNSETLDAYEEKIVKLNALFQFPELTLGRKYPEFVVDIQFLDQKGAVIKEYGSSKPYSFQLTINESAFNSLKAINSPR